MSQESSVARRAGPHPAQTWMIVALAAGLLVRVIGWLALRRAFFCGIPGFEDAVHEARAIALLQGRFPESVLPAGSPIYPYFAALIMRLTGGIQGLLLVQALLGVAVVALIAWAFAPILSPRARWIVALIYALHPVGLALEMRLQPTVFALLLALPALRILFLQPQRNASSAALGGLLLGLGFLLKPWLFFGLAAGAVFTHVRARLARTASGKLRYGPLTALLIAFLLPPILFAAHNATLPGGGFVWNWTDAQSLYRTQVPATWGTPRAQTAPVWTDPAYARTFANEETGRGNTEIRLFGFYAGRAAQLLAENPLRLIGQVLRRVLLLLNGREVPDPVSLRYVLASHAPYLAWGLYLFPLFLAAVAIGLWSLRPRPAADPALDARPANGIALLFPALVALVGVNLLGTHSAASRWFLLVAALPLVWTGIERLPRLIALRTQRSAQLVLGIAGALLVLSALDLPRVGARFENRSEDLRYAAALVAGEDRNRATALLRRALREDPANPAVHKDLGDALLQEDLADAARAEYTAALAIDPAYDPALLGLGEIFRVQADYAQADSIMTRLIARHPQHPLYLNQLAAVKMLRGQYPEAEVLLNRALEIEPTYETALVNLRALDEAKRRSNALAFPEAVTREPSPELVNLGAQAIQALQQQNAAAADSLTPLAMQRFPDDPLALFFRGAFFLRTNRIPEAVELLVRVVKAAPGRAMTTAAAAEALVKAGRSREALELARESLAKAPDDANRTRIEQVIAFVQSGGAPK